MRPALRAAAPAGTSRSCNFTLYDGGRAVYAGPDQRTRYASAAMSYMFMIVEQPGERDVPPDEGKRRFDVMQAFAAELAERGVLGAAESLLTSDTGTRVRRRNGKTSTIDGPFAEAKEIIGGFFLLNCKTLEEATAIAESCPAAEWSIIEVRQLGPCWDGMRT